MREELERYSRHILLDEVGEEGQKRLLRSRVLIVGAGGLGSPAAMYLAAAGVGTIGLMDDDVVELTNLQRQIIHATDHLGWQKVDSAREMLARVNPDVKVVTYPERLTEENAQDILEGYDFIIDGVDNFPAKFLINDVCVRAGKPFCHGGVLRFEGQLMTYVPGQGPCYRCIFEEVPEPGEVPGCGEVGVLGVIPGIIGSLQALEALKYLMGVGELMTGRMLILDGLRMKLREVKFASARADCEACGIGK